MPGCAAWLPSAASSSPRPPRPPSRSKHRACSWPSPCAKSRSSAPAGCPNPSIMRAFRPTTRFPTAKPSTSPSSTPKNSTPSSKTGSARPTSTSKRPKSTSLPYARRLDCTRILIRGLAKISGKPLPNRPAPTHLHTASSSMPVTTSPSPWVDLCPEVTATLRKPSPIDPRPSAFTPPPTSCL